jgi:hypothetical protein
MRLASLETKHDRRREFSHTNTAQKIDRVGDLLALVSQLHAMYHSGFDECCWGWKNNEKSLSKDVTCNFHPNHLFLHVNQQNSNDIILKAYLSN